MSEQQGNNKKRRTSPAWGLLLSLGGVVIALVIVEVVLRALGPVVDPYASNPWIGCVGWAGSPHQRETWVTDEFVTTEVINSAGLPDVEHSYRKPPGVFRILIVGDSFEESWQVNLEDSFPRLLERLLNENRPPDSPRFEVIKAGYRGWGTDQEWLYFQCEGHKYSPDLVLLGFTINDVADNYPPLKAKMAGWPENNAPPKPYYTLENGELKQHNFPFPPPPPEIRPRNLHEYLHKHLVTYRLAGKGWQSLKLKIAEMNRPPNILEEGGQRKNNRYPRHTLQIIMPLYMVPTPAEYKRAWQLTVALLEEFHREVTGSGATFAVYSHSLMWVVHPEIQEILVTGDPLYEGVTLDWEQPDRVLAGVLQEMEAPYFLALDPAFKEYAAEHDDRLLFFREGHWNEEGHELAAELLYQWLVEQKLVP